MKESIVAQRSFKFGLDVIRLIKGFPNTYENTVIIKQMIRSSTSIGANVEEALGTNTKKDFGHCMNIAKKEARETSYWLRLLRELNLSKQSLIDQLLQENQEIISILTSIVKTSSVKPGLRTKDL